MDEERKDIEEVETKDADAVEVIEPVENEYIDYTETIKELTETIKQQTNEIELMKALLNSQFQESNVAVNPENDIENYFNSDKSLTHKILKSYKGEI